LLSGHCGILAVWWEGADITNTMPAGRPGQDHPQRVELR
jgi:hypothetical protein